MQGLKLCDLVVLYWHLVLTKWVYTYPCLKLNLRSGYIERSFHICRSWISGWTLRVCQVTETIVCICVDTWRNRAFVFWGLLHGLFTRRNKIMSSSMWIFSLAVLPICQFLPLSSEQAVRQVICRFWGRCCVWTLSKSLICNFLATSADVLSFCNGILCRGWINIDALLCGVDSLGKNTYPVCVLICVYVYVYVCMLIAG